MKILAVGDSHTQYFGINNQVGVINHALRGIKCTTKRIDGASLAGVGKLSSTLNVGSKISGFIETEKPDFTIFNMGQVDVELGIPFRRYVAKDGKNTPELVEYFLESYMRFLTGLPLPANQVMVKGINLPVLCYDRGKAIQYITRIVTERFTESNEDASRREDIIADLKSTYASDFARTQLALEFNNQLKSACDELGFGYFDINDQLMDGSTGLINPRFIPASFDHHIVDSLEVRSMHWDAFLEAVKPRLWMSA